MNPFESLRRKRRDPFYWEAAPQQAVRRGDWKIYRRALDRPVELYILASDIGETTNVANAHPQIAASLERLLITARTRLIEDGKFFETPPMSGPTNESPTKQEKANKKKQ